MASLTNTLNLGMGSANSVCSAISGALLGVGPSKRYRSITPDLVVNVGPGMVISCTTDNYFRAVLYSKETFKVPSDGTYIVCAASTSSDNLDLLSVETNFLPTTSKGSGVTLSTSFQTFVLSGGGTFDSGKDRGYVYGAICRLS